MLESLAACRLPLAACRLPLAACRLPLAACILTLCSLTIAASNSDARARGGFADFYKAQQARILSAIDDTIATQAERAITDNFAAIKRTGVQLQTGLGGRKGNIAMDFIGGFADSADSAFGWQLRGYKGQQDSTGGNVGVFYRKIDGDTLFGVNAFADYEDGDYGGFLRYSIGGEVQSAWLALHANYYTPITDERRMNMTVAALLRQPIAAFSREGYDAKLRLNLPSYNKLKAAVDYYNFDGKHGAESEDGLRYGMELNISPALKAALFYDDDADKVGGELAYSHTIGESQTRHSRAEGAGISHSPDLFAPVSREYSQRIMTVATGPAISLQIGIVGIITTAMTTAARMITTTTTVGEMISITRMTTDAVLTETPQFSFMTMYSSRAASVEVTMSYETNPNNPALAGNFILGTLNFPVLVTLPEVITRPLVFVQNFNLASLFVQAQANGFANPGIVIITARFFLPGQIFSSGRDEISSYTLTVVEGSERFVVPPTTTTMTTGTVTTTTTPPITTATTMTTDAMPTTMTMTILPVSTTMRATTFATMFITLTANAAMGDISGGIMGGGTLPFDDGGGKGGGITKPPLAIALSPSSSFRPRRHSRAHHRHSRAAGAGISQPKRRFPRYRARMTG